MSSCNLDIVKYSQNTQSVSKKKLIYDEKSLSSVFFGITYIKEKYMKKLKCTN